MKKEKVKFVPLSVLVPVTLIQEVDKIAGKHFKTRSEAVREALVMWLVERD